MSLIEGGRPVIAGNLEILRRKDPDLARRVQEAEASDRVRAFPSRSGLPTAGVRDREGREILLHSAVDPRDEGRRLASAVIEPGTNVYVVFGFGLGYHVSSLLRSTEEEQPEIVVVEGDPGLFRAAVEAVDFAEFDCDRLRFLVGVEPDRLSAELAPHLDLTGLRGLGLLAHPPSARVNGPYYEGAGRALRKAFNSKVVTAATALLHARSWQENYVANLPDAVYTPGVSSFFDAFDGAPAFVVGAGPSLDRNVEELRRAQGRSIILACDTAFKPLLKAGVRPDFVLSIDGSELNYKGFEGIDDRACASTALVAEPMTYHAILQMYPGPRFMCSFGSPLARVVDEHVGPKGFLSAAGSVSTAAFDLARRMGADPIVLVGQDLSYPGGRTYADGTFYAEGEAKVPVDPAGLFEVPAVGGGTVKTPRPMLIVIDWFEKAASTIANLDRSPALFDATEGGALVQGFEPIALEHAVQRYCTRHVDVRGRIIEAQQGYRVRGVGALVRALRRSSRELRDLAKVCEKGDRASESLAAERSPDRIRALLKKLDRIDARIRRHAGAAGLIEALIQPVIFGASRRMSVGRSRGRESVNEGRRLYRAVREAARELAAGLGEAADEIERRKGEGSHGRSRAV